MRLFYWKVKEEFGVDFIAMLSSLNLFVKREGFEGEILCFL